MEAARALSFRRIRDRFDRVKIELFEVIGDAIAC
jgi:hypothetical protein